MKEVLRIVLSIRDDTCLVPELDGSQFVPGEHHLALAILNKCRTFSYLITKVYQSMMYQVQSVPADNTG